MKMSRSMDNEKTELSSGTARSHIEELAGKTLGDYGILEEIGRGGMGVIYKAHQKSLDRIVALKVVKVGIGINEGMIKRFQREAMTAANLKHPNIISIHEVGKSGEFHYFSMNYVDGNTLEEEISKNKISLRRSLEIIIEVAKALQYAHSMGIIHRDVKPSNILIDKNGGVHVGDFGIAKRSKPRFETTQTTGIIGTPHYMSPEQAKGRTVDQRSDIFSLGVVFYEMLTKRVPFDGDTVLNILKKLLEEDPILPRRLNPHIPPEVETICLKALNKQPERRYATALEMAEDIEHFLRGEPIKAKPASTSTVSGKQYDDVVWQLQY
ncbi:MAG TPA: serine/threonine protein kinase [Candidatus Omnitrophica bacterium]|nr:serine/threonine protein kinase [Candidatus Omnitrophota bacterium]